MNIITLASRKGGAGKSTLTAHLAAQSCVTGERALVIDADPQGSLTLWHSLRSGGEPRLFSAARGIEAPLAHAMMEGYDWVFIDTAPSMWVVVTEAIRAATLVLIPARPGLFDLNAVRETVNVARERNRPYAVVLNAAPVKRDDREAPVVAQSRGFLDKLGVPVWSGQISQRAGFALSLGAGLSAAEADVRSLAADEIGRLWNAVRRSVEAINAANAAARANSESARADTPSETGRPRAA
ncbi:MAG: ParA family protein [Proteobacteria bacterium]|nr:ParA family protein [Pseudomonadota bacterium]